MKILITLLITLFISSQAIALDSFEILSKGKIIHQKDRIDEYGSYVDFFVIYKKSLWLCESQTNLKLSNAGLIVCVEHKSYPARDTEGDTVID
tara:strand:+ start:181 stop:459 length:279 start_codon:yes stop_codon:yes gene_type:complete